MDHCRVTIAVRLRSTDGECRNTMHMQMCVCGGGGGEEVDAKDKVNNCVLLSVTGCVWLTSDSVCV